MIENTHRICPLGDLCTDRTTCVLPPGWERVEVYRSDKKHRVAKIKEGEAQYECPLVRGGFQLFLHHGQYYLPNPAGTLYKKAAGLLVLIPLLATSRLLGYSALFFKCFGTAGYGFAKGCITKDYGLVNSSLGGMKERALGILRTILVIAPLMFAVVGMFFAPYQMKVTVADLERWWTQDQDLDKVSWMLSLGHLWTHFCWGNLSSIKVYAAMCFQPVQIRESWIYRCPSPTNSQQTWTMEFPGEKASLSPEKQENLLSEKQRVAYDF